MTEWPRATRRTAVRAALVVRPRAADETGPLCRITPAEGATLISPPDAGISRRLHEATEAALAVLTSRQVSVLHMRFGLGRTARRSLAEISAKLSLSPERILELEADALRRLRRPRRTGAAARMKR